MVVQYLELDFLGDRYCLGRRNWALRHPYAKKLVAGRLGPCSCMHSPWLFRFTDYILLGRHGNLSPMILTKYISFKKYFTGDIVFQFQNARVLICRILAPLITNPAGTTYCTPILIESLRNVD